MYERINWEEYDHLLGSVPDRQIAKIIPCDNSTVYYRRKKLGIKACREQTPSGMLSLRVLSAIEESEKPMKVRDLYDSATQVQLLTLLRETWQRGFLERTGKPRDYAYSLTVKGRKYLKYLRRTLQDRQTKLKN